MALTDWKTKNKEFLELVLPLDLVVRKLLVPILFLIGLVAFLYEIPFPLPAVTIILLIYILVSGTVFWIIRRGFLPGEIAYFILLVIDCFLVTAAIYYSGGIESFMPTVYAIIGILAGLTLPLWAIVGVITVSASLYAAELFLESAQMIPHITIFQEFFRQEQYHVSNYYRIIPLANIIVVIALVFVAHTMADILRKRKERLAALNFDLDKSSKLLVRRDLEANDINRQLDEKIHELEELKTGLEAKVKERTGELEEAKAGLEIKVTERTTELEKERASLEEKVKDRTGDLEKSRKAILHMMKDLKEDIVKLRVVDRMKTEFLSMISHELRTPLTPLKGYLSILFSEKMGQLNDSQKNAIKILIKQIDHLHNMIDSVLDLSRLETGKPIPISKSPLSLKTVIEETAEAMKIEAKEQSMNISLDLQENLPTVLGDETKLRRVLSNLIGNSIKFTPAGGQVTIRASYAEQNARVEVIDNGIGIARENLEKIFERFYQVDSSSTRAAGGMGMGLPIARELIELHGGKLWAESEGIGKGSRFIFTLPVV